MKNLFFLIFPLLFLFSTGESISQSPKDFLGYDNRYYTLHLNDNHYSYLKEGTNVIVIKNKSDLVSSFVGANVLHKMNKSLVFGVEKIEDDDVV